MRARRGADFENGSPIRLRPEMIFGDPSLDRDESDIDFRAALDFSKTAPHRTLALERMTVLD
jgi:hypothetical protein